MTDFATTSMFINGSADEIQRFRSECIRERDEDDRRRVGLDFEALIPTPQLFLDFIDNFNIGQSRPSPEIDGLDWYQWRSTYWGTKWNSLAFEEVLATETSYECIFDTAWRCPEPIMAAIADRYPSFEGDIETKDWSSMRVHEGFITKGIFIFDETGYHLDDDDESEVDEDDDEEA